MVCPVCGNVLSLSVDSKSLICDSRHCFDLAASGYVNLLAGRGGGDTKKAVRARSEFLDAGYYKPVADKLCDILSRHLPKGSAIIDAGCGEGYYTEALVKAGYPVLGFDISKHAVNAASKRLAKSKEAFFAVAGIFDMPVRDASFDGLVNIFAPFAEDEFFRVVKKSGIAAAVWAGPGHLAGLKSLLYDTPTNNEERKDLPKNKKTLDKVHVEYDIIVEGNKNIKNLFAMTPYFWRTSREDAGKLDALEKLVTAVDIFITVYEV